MLLAKQGELKDEMSHIMEARCTQNRDQELFWWRICRANFGPKDFFELRISDKKCSEIFPIFLLNLYFVGPKESHKNSPTELLLERKGKELQPRVRVTEARNLKTAQSFQERVQKVFWPAGEMVS